MILVAERYRPPLASPTMLRPLVALFVVLGTGCSQPPGDLSGAAYARLPEPVVASSRPAFPPRHPVALPIGTPSTDRRCGEKIGTTPARVVCPGGGCGDREPIMSSAQWATERLLRSPIGEGRTFDRRLRGASHRHDFCYQHGLGTYGRTRVGCDDDMVEDTRNICHSLAREVREARLSCDFQSNVVWAAVRLGGGAPYRDNTEGTCEYEDGAHAPRDFVLPARIRLHGGPTEHVLASVAALDTSTLRVRLLRADGAGGVQDAVPPRDVNVPAALAGLPPPCPDSVGCSWTPPRVGAPDLLRLQPRALDIDGVGADTLLLIGIGTEGEETSLGAFALPLALPGAPADVRPGWLRTPQTAREADQSTGRLDAAAVSRQMLALGGEVRRGVFLPGEAGEQLMTASFSGPVTGTTGGIHLGLLHFRSTEAVRRPRLMREDYFDCHAKLGEASPRHCDGFTSRDGDIEAYRRFQYRPVVYREGARHGLRYLIREKEGPQDNAVEVVSISPPLECVTPPTNVWWFHCPERDTAVSRRTVLGWQRSVYPIVDVSARDRDGDTLATSFLATAPRDPGCEALWLAAVRPAADVAVGYAAITARALAVATGRTPEGPCGGSSAADWHSLPVLSAGLGEARRGLLLVRTGYDRDADRFELQLLAATRTPTGWSAELHDCPLPPPLRRHFEAAAARGAGGLALIHAPLVAVGGDGARSTLFWTARHIGPEGTLRAAGPMHGTLSPATGGWTLGGDRC